LHIHIKLALAIGKSKNLQSPSYTQETWSGIEMPSPLTNGGRIDTPQLALCRLGGGGGYEGGGGGQFCIGANP